MKQQYLQWTESDEHGVMKRVPKKPHYARKTHLRLGLNDLKCFLFFNGNFISISLSLTEKQK